MKKALFWISLSGLVAATTAFAAPGGSAGATSAAYSGSGVVGAGSHALPELNAYRKQRAIGALVREAREMQSADGGILTAEHHAYLQDKLNGILAGNY